MKHVHVKPAILTILAALAILTVALSAACSNPADGGSGDGGQKELLQGTVTISGTAKVGETLTANTGGITNGAGTASYQWKRAGTTISGATGGTYTLTAEDEGETITVTVSFSGNEGSLTSAPTGTVQPALTLSRLDTIDIVGNNDITIDVYKNSDNAITSVIVTLPDGSTITGTAISGTQSSGYTITTETGDVAITTAGNTVTVTMQDNSNTTYNINDEQPTLEPYDIIDLAGADEIVIEVYKNSSDAITGVVVTLPDSSTIEGTAISGDQASGYTITTATGNVTIMPGAGNTVTVTMQDSSSTNYNLEPPAIVVPTIPEYTVYSPTEVGNIEFMDQIGGDTIQMLTPYQNTSGGNTAQSAVGNQWTYWLLKMQVQNENLVSGYSALTSTNAYPSALPKINGIITGENAMNSTLGNTNNAASYITAANSSINSILDGVIPAGSKAEFDTYLDVYRKAHIYKQRVWAGRDATGITNAENDYHNAYTSAGNFNGDWKSNFDAILETAELELFTQINNATGLGSVNSAHTATLSGLSTDLIAQIQDLAQAEAARADLDYLGYNSNTVGSLTISQFPNHYREPGDAVTRSEIPPVPQ